VNKNASTEDSNHKKYLYELSSQLVKNKIIHQPIAHEVFDTQNITKVISNKIKESSERLLQDPANNNLQTYASREIIVYQQIISALRAELAEYKSKLNAIQPEIIHYQQAINSLREEITEYRHRQPHSTTNEIPQYHQIINSLGAELAEYKNRNHVVQPQGPRKEQELSSLNAEISRLKRNLDLMISK